MEFHHLPVLLTECMDGLRVVPGGEYLDCTLGGGGHTLEILRRGGRVTGIDRDADAISAASARIEAFLRDAGREISDFRAIRGNFHDAAALVGDLRFDGILADLGVSSFQLDCREARLFLPRGRAAGHAHGRFAGKDGGGHRQRRLRG